MRAFTLIDIEWNEWNGFYAQLLGIEWGNFEGDLFSVNAGPDFLFVNLLFVKFSIIDPFN